MYYKTLQRKKETDFFFFILGQHAPITTVNLHFKKAKQVTVSNAFPTQDFISTPDIQRVSEISTFILTSDRSRQKKKLN
jgi:hypothetical protein